MKQGFSFKDFIFAMMGLATGYIASLFFIFLIMGNFYYPFNTPSDNFINNITLFQIIISIIFSSFAFLIYQNIKAKKMIKKNNEAINQMAHAAAMAETASEVLHNIGNILTIFYVSIEGIEKVIKRSKYQDIERSKEIYDKEKNSLEEYLKEKPQFIKLYDLLFSFGSMINEEYGQIEKFNEKTKEKMKTIKDILTAQQNYAKSKSIKEEITPNELITRSIDIFAYKIERLGVKVDINIESNNLFKAEVNKVVNILTNLIKNAIEAVVNYDDDQAIDIKVYKDKGYQVFSITDSGMGMSKENLNNLFNHGFSTKTSGKGFGLHSCFNLALSFNGHLMAKSEGKGQGATFILQIPLK